MADDPIIRRREEERFGRAALAAALSTLGIAVAPGLPVPILTALLETARRALEKEGARK